MDQEFEQLLEQEGYEVLERNGRFLLIDLLGEFVDSRHASEQALVEYCEQNVFTFQD